MNHLVDKLLQFFLGANSLTPNTISPYQLTTSQLSAYNAAFILEQAAYPPNGVPSHTILRLFTLPQHNPDREYTPVEVVEHLVNVIEQGINESLNRVPSVGKEKLREEKENVVKYIHDAKMGVLYRVFVQVARDGETSTPPYRIRSPFQNTENADLWPQCSQ
jgi:hypothetical protein